MFRGKLFHSVGAAAAKDLLPKYSNRHLGGVSRWFSVDRIVRFGEYGISSSRIYAGASPFKALYVSKRILKSILCFTGGGGGAMQIDEDRGDVIVFAPFSDDASRMILTLLRLGYELLRNTKH